MPTPIIRARDVTKTYLLGGLQTPPKSLRDALAAAFRSPAARIRRARERREQLTFRALDGVSFDVQRGDVLGVMGRNGAGKSTLLKVLSRITEPTSGYIELRGRVASLLEVGTGFHSELSGRENVYLSGTILGMRKREIDRKFDEIVAFAEIEKFIDTPVKRYSSGMYVRLAFAVAAHLEPEILVVDEVLAVGDAEFQAKCIGKMSNVAHEGRTVLFVSHNMAALQSLCTRALLLDRGRVVMDGEVDVAVRHYLAQARAAAQGRERLSYHPEFVPSRVTIEATELLVNGQAASVVQSGDQCTFRLRYRLLGDGVEGLPLAPQIRLLGDGQRIATLWPRLYTANGVGATKTGILECTVERWPFRAKHVTADVASFVGPTLEELIRDAFVFDSHDGDYYGTGVVPHPADGFVFVEHAWRNVPTEAEVFEDVAR